MPEHEEASFGHSLATLPDKAAWQLL